MPIDAYGLFLYWNKTTPLAAIAGMIGALLIHLSLTIIGYFKTDKLSPHDFLNESFHMGCFRIGNTYYSHFNYG